jgi:GT2 family glycosyltransferase
MNRPAAVAEGGDTPAGAGPMAEIDIVVPSAGRREPLVALLDGLWRHSGHNLGRAGGAGPAAVQVVVSDDRPDAVHARWLQSRFPGLRCVAGPGRGPAANRNHGAAQGRAAWLLFLDDDCVVDSDLLGAYRAAAAARPEVPAWQGAVRPLGPRPDPHHAAPVNDDARVLLSGNFAIRRALFERLGGFDADFPHALDDCDLMQRLREAGCAPEFVAQARVLHPWRRSAPHEVWRHMVGHAVMAGKHPGFAADWTAREVARALRGRLRRYGDGWWRIPPAHWPAAALDLTAPLAVAAAVRLPPLRRALADRARRQQRRGDGR